MSRSLTLSLTKGEAELVQNSRNQFAAAVSRG